MAGTDIKDPGPRTVLDCLELLSENGVPRLFFRGACKKRPPENAGENAGKSAVKSVGLRSDEFVEDIKSAAQILTRRKRMRAGF